MVSTVWRAALALLLGACCALPAWAAPEPPKKKTIDEQIEDTFALPKGVVLTTDQQKEAYNLLPGEKESSLRSALQEQEDAKTAADKAAAAKKVMQLKNEIRAAIQKIVKSGTVPAEKKPVVPRATTERKPTAGKPVVPKKPPKEHAPKPPKVPKTPKKPYGKSISGRGPAVPGNVGGGNS